MRYWPETYTKDVLGTVFDVRSQVIMEHAIVERRLRADMLVLPRSARHSREDLGIVDRMLDLGTCVVELFSRTPRAQPGFDCMDKRGAYHGEIRNHARRNHKAGPPRPPLWMISPGQPRSLIAEMLMKPMDHWPEGFWHIGGGFHAHLIVIRSLPEVPQTLMLRLLDTGERYERALAELDSMPEDSRLRKRLVELMVAWRDEMFDTRHEEEQTMLLPESKARYAAWEKRVRGEGIQEGKKEGKKEGLAEGKKAGLAEGKKEGKLEGKRQIVRKQLKLRFGALPADAERRIKRASLARLERWAERLLTAKSLAEVFAD